MLANDGLGLAVETIPPGARYIHGRRLAVAAVSGAAVTAAIVWRGDAGGLAWVVPAAFVVAFMIVAAACLGLYRRLPGRTWDTGPWTGFPSDRDGDVSGYTMPGFVRAHPLFAALWLPGPCIGGAVLIPEGWLDPPYSIAAGIAAGVFAWWWVMLCFSRGWISEGD